MGEPAAKRRRVWLRDGPDGRLYSVHMEADAIGDDLRRAAMPNFNDRDLARVTLRKPDGTSPCLLTPMPLGRARS